METVDASVLVTGNGVYCPISYAIDGENLVVHVLDRKIPECRSLTNSAQEVCAYLMEKELKRYGDNLGIWNWVFYDSIGRADFYNPISRVFMPGGEGMALYEPFKKIMEERKGMTSRIGPRRYTSAEGCAFKRTDTSSWESGFLMGDGADIYDLTGSLVESVYHWERSAVDGGSFGGSFSVTSEGGQLVLKFHGGKPANYGYSYSNIKDSNNF